MFGEVDGEGYCFEDSVGVGDGSLILGASEGDWDGLGESVGEGVGAVVFAVGLEDEQEVHGIFAKVG